MAQEYIDGGARLRGLARYVAGPGGPVVAVFRGAVCRGLALPNKGGGDPLLGFSARTARAATGVPAAPWRSSTRQQDAVHSRIRDAYDIVGLLGAPRVVWIQSPYFVPDEPLMSAMCAAAPGRATDVRLMMTGVPDRSPAVSTPPTPTTSSSSTRG